MRKNSPERLRTEPVHRLLLNMSTHTTMSLLLFSVYSLMDTFFVARGVGAYAAGGIAVVGPLMMVLHAVSSTLGAGGASIVSRALGMNDKEKAARTTASVFLIFWIAAILFTILGMIFLNPLLRMMGAEETLMPYAKGYARIIILGAITSTGFSSIIRAEGNTRFSLYIWVFPVLVNIICDPLFIFVFEWGVEGAALATVLAQAVSAGMSIYYFFFSKRDAYKITPQHFKPQAGLIGETLSIGSPSFISQVGMSFITVVINRMLLQFGGATAITAYGIVTRIQSFMTIPQNGIVQGMQPIIGFNLTSGSTERVKKAFSYSVLYSVVYGVVIMLIGRIFTEELIGIFITEPEVITVAVSALSVIAISFPLIGITTIVSALFQAEGKALRSITISVGGIVAVQLPAVLVMSKLFGLTGIWLSFLISGIIMSTVSLVLAHKSFNKTENITDKEGITNAQ